VAIPGAQKPRGQHEIYQTFLNHRDGEPQSPKGSGSLWTTNRHFLLEARRFHAVIPSEAQRSEEAGFGCGLRSLYLSGDISWFFPVQREAGLPCRLRADKFHMHVRQSIFVLTPSQAGASVSFSCLGSRKSGATIQPSR
jgi:hypothetical protein